MVACLDEARVADLLGGHLSAEEEAQAKRHIDACDACRELLAALARSLTAAADPAPPQSPDDTGPLSRGNTIVTNI